VIIDGVGLVTRFIDHFNTPLVTTSNYNAIANTLTLQITRAHIKPSQSAFTSRFLVTEPNNEDSSVSVLTSETKWQVSEKRFKRF
jgi:hypothetical protein